MRDFVADALDGDVIVWPLGAPDARGSTRLRVARRDRSHNGRLGPAERMAKVKHIFVVAHDGGSEGHSLPFLAFDDYDQALAWLACQADRYSLIEVPIFPGMPEAPWYALKAIEP